MNQKRNQPRFWREPIAAYFKVVFFLVFILIFGFVALPVRAAGNGISGTAFIDLNVDGIRNINEEVMPDLKINLVQNSKIIFSAYTNSLGQYVFENVVPGNYEIVPCYLPKYHGTISGGKVVVKNSDQIFKDLGAYYLTSDPSVYPPMVVVSDFSVKNLSATSVEIRWFSNINTASQLVFGNSKVISSKVSVNENNFGYDKSLPFDFLGKTYHVVVLNNLTPGSQYYYRVITLPDVKQWHGATFIVNNELSFQALPVVGDKKENENQDQGNSNKILNKNNKLDLVRGKILSTEYVEPENASSTPDVIAKEIIEPILANCYLYIIFSVLLNILVIIGLWQLSQITKTNFDKKLWWIDLILVFLPTILAYPECWLVVWLIIMAIYFGIYLLINIGKFKK